MTVKSLGIVCNDDYDYFLMLQTINLDDLIIISTFYFFFGDLIILVIKKILTTVGVALVTATLYQTINQNI